MLALLQGSLVLTFARLTNYVVMFVTPLFLVRMLDVQTYGQYREFLLYATILVGLFSLAIKDNLNYVVPRRPHDAPTAVTQTVGLLLLTTTAGLALFVLGSTWFMSKASFDFLWPLVLYVFFFLNIDVVENYWLAKQQSIYVLIYSTVRVLVRVAAVLVTTYVFNDLKSILVSIVVVEVVKQVACVIILMRLKLLVLRIDRDLLREQMRFIVPLSGAGLLFMVNEKAGHLYISTALGATALAIYTVGTYQLPITAIVRSAVSDTLFPEMVRHAQANSQEGLQLWRVANLYYCFLVFPAFVILFMFAELFIVTLFTEAYLDAVVVFRIALIVMVRQCFEMGAPLRAVNANKYMLWGNLVAIFFHLPLLYFLTRTIGIPGAAVAWLIADFTVAAYLASRIMQRFDVGVSQLALWPQLSKLLVCAVVATPILLLVQIGPKDSLWLAAIAAVAYVGGFVGLVKIAGIAEIDHLMARTLQLVRAAIAGRSA